MFRFLFSIMSDKSDLKQKVIRTFPLTNLALRNRTTIFLLIMVLFIFGGYTYRSLPKELFPDVVFPTIYVQTLYPGNPPIDIENLITRPIEKELEVIKEVKEINSTSSQDISSVFVEFAQDVNIDDALQDVKDAVDKAKSELPNDLDQDPVVLDIDFSEFPILNVNLWGDYSLNELKRYAEYLEDEFEGIFEISKVEIQGLDEREIKINVDRHKMESLEISFDDIDNAINNENISMSGGEIKLGDTRRTVRVIGEFTNLDELADIIVKNEDDDIVHLKEIAEIIDGFEDPRDFARLNKQPVVSLQVIKKGGENLLSATDQVFEILDNARLTKQIPDDLQITITNDQSDIIRKQLSNLENSMILGVIFVIMVLYFFLGTRNALFVGFAIPLSMFISFIVLGLIGSRVNMIVLFSLILALGLLVDNAIVVVENIYRFIDRGYDKVTSARYAVGEIAQPIISSTATTLAAFFPLLFWNSLIGEFMKYLPLTLIIVLTSSLFVALVIVPVVSSYFIKPGDQLAKPNNRRILVIATLMLLLSVPVYLAGWNILGSLLVIFGILGFLNILFLNSAARWFQSSFLPRLEKAYLETMKYALKKKNPYVFISATVLLLIFTLLLLGIRSPEVEFFPSQDPQYINIIAELPIGTDIEFTNEFMKDFEDDVYRLLEPYEDITKSVLTTIGSGAKSENDFLDFTEKSHKGMITITFVDYELRHGINTFDIQRELSDALIGNYPGVLLSVEKQAEGPPVGREVNIEISGQDFIALLDLTDSLQTYIERSNIPGIEGLKIDLDVGKPEIIFHIDRERARRYGISTAQIALTIRTALFGREVSDFKEGEDKYPIQLRLKEEYRYNLPSLLNQRVTFRSASTGKIKQVPISAVTDASYSTSYGAIKRKDLKRMITLYSNVIKGYNATDINDQLKELLKNYDMPAGYSYAFTGEQQEQEESLAFLSRALLIAIALIMIILVSQFNSIIKPVIIIITVIFSTIGVFGGLATFNMDFIVIMTGIGIVSLAGIVVNNAIVLIDYIDLLKARKRKELGLEEKSDLPVNIIRQCVIEGGKTRLRPVLLTAITTILGLLPLASGLNIDIISLLENFDAKIYFGGDNVAFWGPISWTIIFGLTFSTFLTLIIVPCMYLVFNIGKLKMNNWKKTPQLNTQKAGS